MAVTVGMRAEAAITVDQQITALGMRAGGTTACATAALVALIERASVNAIQRHLAEGQDSVGTAVNIQHLGYTPVGRRVRAEAEVTAVDGRRISFAVRAFDSKEKVAEGTHQRAIVEKEDFLWKLAAKGT